MINKIVIFTAILLVAASLVYLDANQMSCNLKPASPVSDDTTVSTASRDYRDNLTAEDKAAAYFQNPLENLNARDIGPTFGWRIHSILRTPDFHTGIDIEGVMGEPIFSIFDGVVTSTGWNGGYGLMVKIEHNDAHGAFETLYAHNSKNLVEVGDKVAAGQVIGYVGSTGMSTTPHLHFEVRISGKPVDPELFLKDKNIGGL